ncbi:hypothetical protein GLOIN_2v1837326 [Rhizophagus irregularis DAOM 181602=DAOM 197198]|nr:hypothetical protein GLOIN_2v1837326 [Rhizophagus irregularis DAOM 181602=DAOM 197198]
MFSMIEIDFDQYMQKLSENNLEESLEKFRNLLTFAKEKYLEDLKILSNNTGKEKEGKGKNSNQNSYLKKEQISNFNILDVIADEITCPINSEPTDQLCILKCQHMLALSNLKKLKQKICPNCREKIEDNDIRYLPQNSIYKNLAAKAIENYNIALKNDPNNYLCLKNCAYIYEIKVDYLNPLNSSAYYLKSLTYYAKNDNNKAKVSFKKYAELLNSDNTLAKIQLFHLEYLLNKNSSIYLNNILKKIDQIHIYKDESLHFIECKTYIELKEYSKAIPLLNNYIGFTFIVKLMIINILNSLEHGVYFVSNLINLNSELCQFQESDISSLSGLVMSSKNENLHLVLPKLENNYYDNLICKMNVKKILSKDCFIKFIPNGNYRKDYMLKHKDVSKLEGLGWIEYQISIYGLHNAQLSIEINSIEMQIEYVRFDNPNTITYIPDMSFMNILNSL